MGVPALYLKKGSLIASPASDEVALIAEADGTVKSLLSNGTRSALGGAALSSFQTRMNTLCDSLATFTGKRYLTLGTYPSGVAIASLTNNQTAVSGGGLKSTPTPLAMTNSLVQTPKTLPWFAACRMKVTGAFAGANYALFGTHDGTNDFVRAGYAGGTSNSFWSIDVGHGGATTPVVSTTALDNNAHDHALYFDGSTALTYYLDSVLIATVNVLTNFPTTTQVIMGMSNTTAGNHTELFYAFNETA